MRSGSFADGTFHLTDFTHLAFRLSPPVFVGRLPRLTLPPVSWSRGFRRTSGTIRPSDDSHDTASHFACAYRVTSLGATRGSWKPSWGHAQIFHTVPSANTLVRWVDENAFAPIVRARPCPTFGRPVRPWGSPHRLRPGISPHTLRIPPRGGHPVLRSTTSGGFRSVLRVSGFRLRALRDVSIPFLSLRPARHYPRFWIRRSSSERRRDLNPPDPGAAQRTLRPLLTSASGSGRLATPSVPRDVMQISWGKPRSLPRTPAGFTVLALDGYGLCDFLPARPTSAASYPVAVRRVAILLHASFRQFLAVLPLRFTRASPPSGCTGGFHPLAAGHARHTGRLWRRFTVASLRSAILDRGCARCLLPIRGRGKETVLGASRPAGSHRQPLSEPYMSLSTHTAPIRRTRRSCQSASARTGSCNSCSVEAGNDLREPCVP